MSAKLFVGTGEIGRLTGIDPAGVKRLVEAGIIRPASLGVGRGARHVFTFGELLAIALFREARRRGLPVTSANAVARFFAGRSVESLQRDFAERRSLMLVVGETVLQRLISPEALAETGQADVAELVRRGVPVAAVDVQRAFDQLLAALEADRAARDVSEDPEAVAAAEGRDG